MKNKDLVIIAAVGLAAYMYMQKGKKNDKQRGYTLAIPAPDVLSQAEYERQITEARKKDALANVIKSAGSFLSNLFAKDRRPATIQQRGRLSAGMSPVVGPKKIGILF